MLPSVLHELLQLPTVAVMQFEMLALRNHMIAMSNSPLAAALV